MLLRLATAPLSAGKRDDIAGAEDLLLPLDADVCFVPGNERSGYLAGVLALSSRSDAAGIFICAGIDRPPKNLLFQGGRLDTKKYATDSRVVPRGRQAMGPGV